MLKKVITRSQAKAVITSPTRPDSTQLNSTGQKNRQFAVSREVLNMLRISRLTGNWQLFVELS